MRVRIQVENLRGLELARLEDIRQGKVLEHNSCPHDGMDSRWNARYRDNCR